MQSPDPFQARLPSCLPLDADALELYKRALRIGKVVETQGPPITFAVGMIALLEGTDELSQWFAEKAAVLGPDKKALYEYKKTTDTAVKEAPDVVTDEQLLTVSSRNLLDNACAWAQRVDGQQIGIRHILAAYLISPPPNHRRHLAEWRVREDEWRTAFFDRVAPNFTHERWQDARNLSAPAAQVAHILPTQTIKAEDLVWSGDEQAARILRNAQAAHEFASYQGWLKTRMLLFSLVECARIIPNVKTQIAPLWDLVEANQQKYADAKTAAKLAGWSAGEVADTTVTLALTPQLANLLETARQLSRSTKTAFVGPLELVAALASRRVDAGDELLSCGVEPAKLRDAVLATVKETEIWRDVMDPESTQFAARPVKLDSDEPEAEVRADNAWTSDPLLRKPDVEAFAALLAARDLEPPLSIGLFGPWGSGKTTFLRRLRRAVQVRADSKSPDYVTNVVHVEFNAWHYAEADLVASVVDSVFRKIDEFVGGEKPDGATWLQQEEHKLESARQRAASAKAARDAAIAKATEATKALETATTAARVQQSVVATAIASSWRETKTAVEKDQAVKDSKIVESIGDVVESANEVRARIAALRRPGRLLANVGWGTWSFIVVAMIGLPVLAAAVANRLFGADGVVQGITMLTSVLAVVAGGLRTISSAVARVDEAGAKVEAEFAKQITESKEVKAAQSALDASRAAVQAAEASVAQTQAEVVRAETVVAEASVPAQVARLAAARINEQTYAKALGLITTARADFSDLSTWLREQKSTTAKPDQPKPPKHVDRVILYIDDLDRCSPEQVVKVLQLVHMLLAFELFVVVVGVDAHWVRHALERAVRGLSSKSVEGAPTPQEYLEKIFQIAFWLEPMNPSRVASYVEALVRKPGEARTWDIGMFELDFLRALSAQVATSPRRAKRLINVYRLIKARLSDTQLETFLTRTNNSSGPYQIAIALLVISVGAADVGPAILDDLAAAADKSLGEVIKRYRAASQPAWSAAADVLETLAATQPAMPFTELRGWALHVARFLLHPRAAA